MRYNLLGSTGASVSVIGFGGSPLGDVFGVADPAESIHAVHLAIDYGINLFDVSPYYGRTLAEERLGQALEGKRENVFISTKCGRYGENSFDFSAARVKSSIDESLRRLRTDRVDLLLAHDVEFGEARQIVEETIPALREIQRQGKTRFIGVSGYPLGVLREIAAGAPVDTVLSYCHYNLMSADLDLVLEPFARRNRIGLINGSPLHMGILSDSGPPQWHPAPQAVKDAGASVVRLCNERHADPAVIALRFCLDYDGCAATLVGMSTSDHVQRNLRALNAQIDPDLLREVEEIVAPVKNAVWPSGRPENQDVSGQSITRSRPVE